MTRYPIADFIVNKKDSFCFDAFLWKQTIYSLSNLLVIQCYFLHHYSSPISIKLGIFRHKTNIARKTVSIDPASSSARKSRLLIELSFSVGLLIFLINQEIQKRSSFVLVQPSQSVWRKKNYFRLSREKTFKHF